MKYKIEMFFYLLFKKLIRMLSIKWRYKLADKIGILLYKILKSRRKTTIKNIKIAFPNLDDDEVKNLAIKSFKNISKTFLEILWLDQLKVELQGEEIFREIANRGKGAIMLTMHMGNWECVGYKTAEKKFNIYGVFKKLKSPLLNEEVRKIRTKTGMIMVEKGKRNSLRFFIKALKENGILGLASDQFTNDIDVKFFSRKTKAPAGAANFSVKFDLPVVLVYDYRKEDNSHIVVVEKEIKNVLSGNIKEDIKINTQNYIYEMEKIIKRHPEQWFWQHKRWRD